MLICLRELRFTGVLPLASQPGVYLARTCRTVNVNGPEERLKAKIDETGTLLPSPYESKILRSLNRQPREGRQKVQVVSESRDFSRTLQTDLTLQHARRYWVLRCVLPRGGDRTNPIRVEVEVTKTRPGGPCLLANSRSPSRFFTSHPIVVSFHTTFHDNT